MKQESFNGLSPAGFHRVAYTEWGPPTRDRAAICVHGLTRNGRDFDVLAQHLAQDVRVACPDIVGRGQSDWLMNPEFYSNQQYIADMAVLIAKLAIEEVDWVGTSMGGIVGVSMAALPRNPIRRLVINDIGPFVPKEALARIQANVGEAIYDDLADAEKDLRRVCAGFGDLTDAQWRHLTAHSIRELPDGRLTRVYDPDVALAAGKAAKRDISFWEIYDAVRCPVLVLRGKESDVLTEETATEMSRRGPRAEIVEVEGCGHAPALMSSDQVKVVRDWLNG